MRQFRSLSRGGLGLGLLFLLGAALRFYALGDQSFELDETATVKVVHHSFGGMLGAVWLGESTPPLYYVLAWGWEHLFGTGEWGLRSLSALAGAGAVPVTFAAARHFATRRGAVIAAALVACNPALVWYSQEARSYSLLVFLAAVTVLLFARARERPTAGRLGAWAAACALALLTHYFAVFLVVGEGLLLWMAVPARRRAASWALCAVGAAGLALLPLALHQQAQGGTAWIGAMPLADRLKTVARELASANAALVTSDAPARPGLAVLLALALVWGTTLILFGRLPVNERAQALAAGALGAAAILLPLALLVIGVDLFLDRNVLAAWVPLAIVLGAVLGGRRAGSWGVAVAAVLCLAGIAANLEIAARSDLQRENWRAASNALGQPSRRQVVVMYPPYVRIPLEVYGQRLPESPPTVRVREVDLVEGVYPPRLRPPVGFHLAARTRLGRLTVLRFTARSPVSVTRSELERGITFPASVTPPRRQLERRWNAEVSYRGAAGHE